MTRVALLASLLLVGPVTGQRTWIVEAANGPGTNFIDVPAAVAAAADGDTILVRPHPLPAGIPSVAQWGSTDQRRDRHDSRCHLEERHPLEAMAGAPFGELWLDALGIYFITAGVQNAAETWPVDIPIPPSAPRGLPVALQALAGPGLDVTLTNPVVVIRN